jgi:hypothetical protein
MEPGDLVLTPGWAWHAPLPGVNFLAISQSKGNAMAAVHYYLGRPARVWISAHSPRSAARQARNGSGRVHGGIPGQAATGLTPSTPGVAPGSPDASSRRVGNRKSSVTATSSLPPTLPPSAACWPAAGSPSPASAPTWPPLAASARLWPPDWTRPATRPCPQACPRPGNAPTSTWGSASGTRSCTRHRWPNCTS